MQMQINMQSASVTLSKIPSFFFLGGGTFIAMKVIYILVLHFIDDNPK